MFTGIVAGIGNAVSVESHGTASKSGDLSLRIDTPMALMQDCHTGDSICVSGVCLTMLEPDDTGFLADVSAETVEKTTLGDCQAGDKFNLELALRASDRLGGHLVSGHVDGLARLVARVEDVRSERFQFETVPGLARFIAPKGSVCIDGVSLTVNDVGEERFWVCVIPHTLKVTTLGSLAAGDEVNLEIDLVARYLARMNEYGNGSNTGKRNHANGT